MNYSYTTTQHASSFSPILGLLYLIIIVLAVVVFWKIFTKAGKPGWACLIPFYNTYTMLKIVGRPGWWLVLYFIPIVNIIISLIVSIDLAKSFSRSETFGVLALWLFGIVGYPMLAFGSSKYIGPSHTSGTAVTPSQTVSQPVSPTPAPTQS